MSMTFFLFVLFNLIIRLLNLSHLRMYVNILTDPLNCCDSYKDINKKIASADLLLYLLLRIL